MWWRPSTEALSCEWTKTHDYNTPRLGVMLWLVPFIIPNMTKSTCWPSCDACQSLSSPLMSQRPFCGQWSAPKAAVIPAPLFGHNDAAAAWELSLFEDHLCFHQDWPRTSLNESHQFISVGFSHRCFRNQADQFKTSHETFYFLKICFFLLPSGSLRFFLLLFFMTNLYVKISWHGTQSCERINVK